MLHYADAYLLARTITTLGTTVKNIAIVIAVAIAIVGIISGISSGSSAMSAKIAIGGFILAVIVGIPIYVLVVTVSGLGQILMASLDTSVHTSPLLIKDDMQKIISLH